jgi:hypothetical protein
MKRTLIALVMAAVACSGEAPLGPDDEEEQEEELDTTPPRVVSISPANGSAGVRADEPVVIAFSEPMDRGSVEGSLATASLGDVTLAWNDAGDSLTIVPDEPLEYGLGVAIQYHVIVGGGARDLAGNPLGEGVQASFTTLRRVETDLDLDLGLTGHVIDDGSVVQGPVTGAGDDASNRAYRMLVTVDLGKLPEGAVEIAEATLYGSYLYSVGDPFGLAARLQLEHVSYDALDLEAFFSTPHAHLGPVCCELEQPGIRAGITAALEEDRLHRVARGDRSQYRLRFDALTNGDGVADLAAFGRETFGVSALYLIP